MANLAPRPAWQRGLAALLVFLLAFLVTMVVGWIIGFMILIGPLGYDMFPWGSNPVPDSHNKIGLRAVVGTSLALASFLGWKVWRHRR